MTKTQEDQSLVSTIVSAAIDRLATRKTQKELAREMGFLKPGMLSMIKTGAARIPFAKLPNVAAALGIDPALLIRTHLCETWPEFEDVVHEVFGGVLTATERDWIEFFEGMGMLAPPADLEKRAKLQKILLSHDWEEEGEALSIWQPWASLIISGEKKIETRSWPAPYSIRGTRIAVASTRTIQGEQRRAAAEDAFRLHHAATGLPKLGDLPMGCVLGTGVVKGCRAIDSEFMQELDEQEDAFGWYGPGRFAWFLKDPERLAMPVTVRGGQGLWNWSPP